jgi:hypothetical protein
LKERWAFRISVYLYETGRLVGFITISSYGFKQALLIPAKASASRHDLRRPVSSMWASSKEASHGSSLSLRRDILDCRLARLGLVSLV